MTIEEASEHYSIPLDILKEYESWGLCSNMKKVIGAWEYDDQDIEWLSMIMTLHDIGFKSNEIEEYMHLLLKREITKKQRLLMLNQKRSETLNEVHMKEAQISQLDYLRSKVRHTL